MLAALETTGWDDVLKEAKDAGKVVVLEDRRIDAAEDLYATYIGSDFAEEGRKSADEMCKLLEGSASKNVVELVGNVGSSAAKDRGQGFREKMGDCGITITQTQTANWSSTEGKAVMEAWLKQSTDIQGVFAQNDEMALGAILAIQEAGLKPGVDIKILSVDATAGAFKALVEGTLNVTVECNPLLAPQVYEAALKALNGETLPKWVPSQEGVFRSDDREPGGCLQDPQVLKRGQLPKARKHPEAEVAQVGGEAASAASPPGTPKRYLRKAGGTMAEYR